MALNAVDPATIIASASAGRGHVLQVVIPQDIAKVKDYHGAKFLTVKLTAWASDAKPIDIIYAGRTSPLNIPILFGAPEPETNQGSSSNKRTSICLPLSDCADLGAALEICEREFLAQVQSSDTQKKIWTDDTPAQYICHIKRKYGKKCKDQSKKNQDREEPLVSLNAEFGKFADRYFKKVLAGKSKTTIYDWSSRTINEAGQELFAERTDITGQTFNATNASQILATGDIIRRIALMVDSVSISDRGIALRFFIYKVWTERMTGEINFIPASSASASTSAPEYVTSTIADANGNDEGLYDDQ